MINIFDLHKKNMENPEYKHHYEELEQEFVVASAIIKLRKELDLSQTALADLMDSKQTVIARLESGEHNPTLKTLKRIASSTGTRLVVSFEKSMYDTPDPESMILEP